MAGNHQDPRTLIKSSSSAILEDCNNLLDRFDSKSVINFDTFSEIWREMSFSLIFCGCRSEEELIETSMQILQAAKCCWLPPNAPSRRLLASYLIYGLYFKQPFIGKGKICVTITEWSHICDFKNFIVKKHLQEHIYMFSRLVEADAFLFSACPSDATLEKRMQAGTREMEMESLMSGDGIIPKSSAPLSTVLASGHLDKITQIETEYEEQKLAAAAMKVMPSREEGMNGVVKDLGFQLRNMCLRQSLNTSVKPAAYKTKPALPAPVSSKRAVKNKYLKNAIQKSNNVAAADDVDGNPPNDDTAAPTAATKQKRKERGFNLSTKLKQHRDLIGAPNEGMYNLIHSVNNRNLFHKILPKQVQSKLKKKQKVEPQDQPEPKLRKMQADAGVSSEYEQAGASSTSKCEEPGTSSAIYDQPGTSSAGCGQPGMSMSLLEENDIANKGSVVYFEEKSSDSPQISEDECLEALSQMLQSDFVDMSTELVDDEADRIDLNLDMPFL